MYFNDYLIRYWHMSETEFNTFSNETKQKIRHEYAVFLNRGK